ncbi:VOC family protein [Ramlibacter sp.]|uniref:VOC family protein n=1 Tax=Ramlibacter sp. TaxID=1917967 RepID=UPI002D272D96|nr:VOC family protein [Ramlibacter sp.]HYD76430.1 VOC family protein [Ramlibacter sp.]
MPTIDCYIFFDGQCSQAMRFYEQTLGGRMETFMTYAQSPEPDQCPPGSADRIMHASLVLDGDCRLMASDSPAGQHKPMAGFGLALTYPSAQEARKVFEALCAGGSVTMPMGKTFWAEAFGMCTDRFGTPWMVGGGQQAG